MLSRIFTVCLHGIEPKEVCVEVNVTSRGFPSLDIVGMAGKNVQESKERVRSAIISSGFEFPQKKVLINLMPADLPKDGTSFDLPIAVGILACTLNLSIPKPALFYGELTLSGQLNYTKGCFTLGMYIAGYRGFAKDGPVAFVPANSAVELSNIPKVHYFCFNSLLEVINHLQNKKVISLSIGKRGRSIPSPTSSNFDKSGSFADISDIQGQIRAKRALLVGLAGKHNILFIGSPGSGKTMLAKSAHSLQPPLYFEDSLEVTKVYSSCGLLPAEQGLITKPPFRSPHHASTVSGLLGGGNSFRVGEITLAHKGILFLDELPEFSPRALESLRQPLEDRHINLTKSGYSLRLPADFMLIATANPCQCGWFGDINHHCTCTVMQRARYLSRVSGPILDRIDIIIPVHTINSELQGIFSTHSEVPMKIESSSDLHLDTVAMRRKVDLVRRVQYKRLHNSTKNPFKSTLNNISGIFNTLSSENQQILFKSQEHFKFSLRTLDKVLSLCRTIADLEQSTEIGPNHILEALSYKTSYLSLMGNS